MLGMSRGKSARALAAKEKLNEGEAPTWREAELMREAGLINDEKSRKAYLEAQYAEAQRRGIKGRELDRLKAEYEGATAREEELRVERADAVTDVKIAQSIVVKLERSQSTEIDELMKSVQPKFEELLRLRNQELLNALAAGMEEAIRRQVDEMDSNQIQQQLEAQL